jgi:hypothetical protein
MYIIFITFCVLIELNVFFIVNVCYERWKQLILIFIYLTYYVYFWGDFMSSSIIREDFILFCTWAGMTRLV